jgi:hypothetical protein
MTRPSERSFGGHIPPSLRERPACLVLLKRSIDLAPEPVNRVLPRCFAAIMATVLGFPASPV